MAMASDFDKSSDGGEETKLTMGIKDLVDSGLNRVPPTYILPPEERPNALPLFGQLPQSRIPVIDLAPLLHHDNDAARATLIQELACACEDWGFFQVINHGIEPAVIQRLRGAALKFFMQPLQEKMHWRTQNFEKPVRYGSSFNASKEKVRDWRDFLSFDRHPGIFNGFQEAPDICKKEAQEYVGEVEVLARKLYKAIFESVGLDDEYIGRELPGIPWVTMLINYYPPCPKPSLTLGMSAHSDVCCLTILHPDDVPGLQIKHKGSWLPVFPVHPSAFIVNLADQIEILTNGKYKSVEHRAVTNGDKSRMSIACFFRPMEEAIVTPLQKLLNENKPPLYRATKFKEYYENFLSNRLLSNRSTLDFVRI